jgi:hypothetical protein
MKKFAAGRLAHLAFAQNVLCLCRCLFLKKRAFAHICALCNAPIDIDLDE